MTQNCTWQIKGKNSYEMRANMRFLSVEKCCDVVSTRLDGGSLDHWAMEGTKAYKSNGTLEIWWQTDNSRSLGGWRMDIQYAG